MVASQAVLCHFEGLQSMSSKIQNQMEKRNKI